MNMKLTAVCSLVLSLVLALGLTACGGTPEETPTAAEPEDAVTYTNDGLVIYIPEEYADLLLVDAPADSPEGTLFTVTEKASAEWGEKQHPGEDWGDGWLFSLGRIDEDALHEMLCYDMSGAIPIAVDGDGNYYVFYHPTDVRFVRESYEIDNASEDWKRWAELNDWAWDVSESFVTENAGLTAYNRTNTSVDICLAQLAYMDDDMPYTISTAAYGPLEPNGVDKTPYLDRLLDGVTFEMAESCETPDGEYVVLELPEAGERFDFFVSDGNYVREVYDGEETLYRAAYAGGNVTAADIMLEWYDALAAANGAA